MRNDWVDLEDVFEALKLENAVLERLSRRLVKSNTKEAQFVSKMIYEQQINISEYQDIYFCRLKKG